LVSTDVKNRQLWDWEQCQHLPLVVTLLIMLLDT